MRWAYWISILLAIHALPAVAGEADVIGVAVKQRGNGLYQFDVTVQHTDEGWDHFVDKWDVLAPDGSVLASRSLFQPQTGKPSFTSSLVGVKVPDGIREVTIRAHDSVHGYSGKTFTISIP